MAKNRVSSKQLAINKDQARIVIMVVAAAALLVFSLVASRNLIGKILHQNRVITAKTEARDQLDTNIQRLEELQGSYDIFEAAPESVLGNSNESNSKVVLDALPSKYDFAAVLTSIEAIASQGDYNISDISGVDDALDAIQTSTDPGPVEIPLNLSMQATYAQTQDFVNDLYRSIRPINVEKLKMTGSDDQINMIVDVTTYYQPEKIFDVSTEDIE